MKQLVLATGNQGKVREMRALLEDITELPPLEVLNQKALGVDDAEETGLTFVENAILKARHAARVTGLPALADDSGLSVDCLGGAPGIYSARYAGPTASDADNINKLLNALDHHDADKPIARFHCVLVLLRSAEDPVPLVCHGQWQGCITRTPAGNNGFGYDPIFFVPEKNCTAAQLAPEEKNRLSHRGQALQLLRQQLQANPTFLR